MSIFRKSRYIVWIARDLASKYIWSILLGFFIGFITTIIFNFYGFLIFNKFIAPVERIGIVGEYTTQTLPEYIQNQISFGLTKIDETGLILPGLAYKWESTDSGKLYTFYLNDDLYWQNGQNVQADDVNYNINNVTFAVKSPYILEAKLKEAYNPFASIVSKPLFKSGFVGFGNYKVSKIRFHGNSIEYLKVDTVKPNIGMPSREYKFYKTEHDALMAFKLGQIDQIYDLSVIPDLKNWVNVKIVENIRYDRIVALFFNITDKFLAEKNHRLALGYALPPLDVEKADSPISKESWAYSENVRLFKPDPTSVKKYLEDVSVDKDDINITITAFPIYLDLAQDIAQSWTSYGIKTKVKVENYVPSDYQVLISGFDLPPDPDQYFFWHSLQANTNITKYVNVKIDKLLEDARNQPMTMDERKELYADFQRRLTEDSPAIFLYYPKNYILKRI